MNHTSDTQCISLTTSPLRHFSPRKHPLLSLGTLVLFFFFLWSAPSAQAAEEHRVLKVAFPETVGINEIYEDGTYGGCVYDWLMEIAKYTGWEYEFVTDGSATELLRGMANCEYDLMAGRTYHP